jgi:hypothetical protein
MGPSGSTFQKRADSKANAHECERMRKFVAWVENLF